MSERLSAEREAEIRDREQQAEPGPWVQGSWSGQCHLRHEGMVGHPGGKACVYDYELNTDIGLWREMVSLGAKPGEVLINSCHEYCKHRWEDIAFIAHSRQDIPDLLAELDAVRAERDLALGDREQMKEREA